MTQLTPDTLRQTAIAATLRACEVFSGLDEKDISALSSMAELRSYEKGEFVFHKGDYLDGIFVIQTGQIDLHDITPEGRKAVFHIFGPLDCFGAHAISTNTACTVSCMALRSLQLIVFPKAPFLAQLRRSPDLALRIIASLILHIRILLQSVYLTKSNRTARRLALWLVERLESPATMGPQAEKIITLDMSQKLLASRLGVTKETLSRTFAQFRREGILTFDRKSIRIDNLTALHTRAYGKGRRK